MLSLLAAFACDEDCVDAPDEDEDAVYHHEIYHHHHHDRLGVG